MRYWVSVFFLFTFSVLFAQKAQWRVHEEKLLGHYDNQIFTELIGTDQAVSIYLDKQTDGTPLLVLNQIDVCGTELKRHDIDYLSFSPRYLLDVVRDKAGAIYIGGMADSTMPYGTLFVIKINPNLQLAWAKRYTSPAEPYPYNFNINQDDELFFLFNTTDQAYGNSLLKLNSAGDVIWGKSVGYNPIWGRGSPTDDGGYLMSSGSLVFKVDAQGIMQWRTLISIGHVISNVISIDGGYMFYHQRDAASAIGRVVMLNQNGTFRWATPSYTSFRGIKAIKVGPQEVQFLGTGISNDPSAPSGNSLCVMLVNTSGNVLDMAYLNKGVSNSYRDGFDLVYTNNYEYYLVEKRTDGANDFVQYLHFDTSVDSIRCYDRYPYSPSTTATLLDSVMPTNPSTNIPFTVTDFTVYLSPRPTPIPLVIRCLVSDRTDTFSLGNDTLLCPTETIQLSGPDNYEYFWSTGENTQQIEVNQSGWYWLTTRALCSGDSAIDSVYIEIAPEANPSLQGVQSQYDINKVLMAQASANVNGQFYWYLNDVLIDSGQTLSYPLDQAGPQVLDLVFIDDNGCSFVLSKPFLVSPEIPTMPNVFSPNGDGASDTFLPFDAEGASYRMLIYNRFGSLLAEKNSQAWDGRAKPGETVAAGVYFYVLYWRDNPEPYKGSLTLIR